MHITEGIITGVPAVLYTAAGVGVMAWGTSCMKRFARRFHDRRALLGMGGALIFFISLIPIPAFTGTCTHPAGTPLVAILLGPGVAAALAGLSLLLQAAFFAHGGFGTWGANLLCLGLLGGLGGWAVFRLCRWSRMPLWAAGMAGGLIGELLVYAGSGLILASTLAQAPNAVYSWKGYLLAIYGAYLPTQIPIAMGEMVLTGVALHNIFKKRPEVLAALGVTSSVRGPGLAKIACVTTALLAVLMLMGASAHAGPYLSNTDVNPTAPAVQESLMPGMDEVVNERMAEQAGIKVRDPLINIEEMGDLWNALLLLAGCACGFVLGRWWHLLWDKDAKAGGGESEDGKATVTTPVRP